MSNNSSNTASQPCHTARLPEPNRLRAVNFILEFGTNLQRERYLYHFSLPHDANPHDTSPHDTSNVLAALRHYQNQDGGFGHGLEADLRTKQSSVIATTVALQILQVTNALHSDLAKDGLQYMIGKYEQKNWLPITADCNDAPHAPWWLYRSGNISPASFVANPGAEVLSYLITHRAMASELPDLLERAMAYLSHHDLEMHDLLCFMRLFENPDLDTSYKGTMLPYLLSNGYRLVKVEEVDWEEYCLTPLTVIARPNSIFTEFFEDSLERNFAFRINRQNEDGSWSPNWSWGGEFPATWKTVETEIKAELTLRFLCQLKQFGRLETII